MKVIVKNAYCETSNQIYYLWVGEDADVQLVAKYRQDLNDDTIDHDLIYALIHHLHENTDTDNAILVFFSGYDDMCAQSAKIEEHLCPNHKLFLLHSGIEHDEAVFSRMQNGIRKIVLATNIAETSITIDDVVSLFEANFFKIMY